MPLIRPFIALAVLTGTQGCVALEALGGRCTQEQLVLTWPVSITRASGTSSTLLTATLTPSNVDQARFDLLRAGLVQGSTAATNVTWTVSAFDSNGGYIAFAHLTPFSAGETRQITGAFSGGGWGASAAGPADLSGTTVSMRDGSFNATSATGSLTALDTSPLRLRIDVTGRNAAGESIRVLGDAGFGYQKVTRPCID